MQALVVVSGDRYGCPGEFEHDLVSSFRKGCPSGLNDVRCALKKMKDIELWLSRSNHFKVLITGKMGTGKSTLVKGLTEDYKLEADNLLPHTVKVTPYSFEKDKIGLTIFDTPGLKDEVNGSNDYSYLEDMVKNSQEPNLLIFAIRMDDSSFRKEDMAAINDISAAFGWKVWKNAIIVLTFANKVHQEGMAYNSRENKVHYTRVRNEFSLKITEILREYKVQAEVADNIPIIPVGLVQEPIIPSDERKMSWVEEFWDTVHARLKVSRRDMSTDENAPSPTTSPPSSPDLCYYRPLYLDCILIGFGMLLAIVLLGLLAIINDQANQHKKK